MGALHDYPNRLHAYTTNYLHFLTLPRSQVTAPLMLSPSVHIPLGLLMQKRPLFIGSGLPPGKKQSKTTFRRLESYRSATIPQISTQFAVEPLLHIPSNNPMSSQFSHPRAKKDAQRVVMTAVNKKTSAPLMIGDRLERRDVQCYR